MSKIFLFLALVAMVALLACGGDDATEAPADTQAPEPTAVPTSQPEPTAAPEPTDVPEPTATPEPEPTTAPEPTAPPEPEPTAQVSEATEAPTMPPAPQQSAPASGQIAPLTMDDPAAMASEFSDSELACFAGVAEIEVLLSIFTSPEFATPEQQTQLINCMSDETVTRLFLTGVLVNTGALSVESSMCIRLGMEGVDLRSVMLAGAVGNEEAAMIGGMGAFTLALSCLNDEEWDAAAPALGIPPEQRESQLCALDKLGGPEGLAAAFESGAEGAIMALLLAATECGVPMSGNPGG